MYLAQPKLKKRARATRRLVVTVLLVTSALVPYQSDSQDVEGSGQTPSPRDIDQFFQGKLPVGNAWARENARFLRLMGEQHLVETVRMQAPQVYRLLIESRPYGVPVVVRLSIAPDGIGEVVAKIGHSLRFPDRLTANRIAKVSEKERDEFLRLLADSGFWSMPVFETIDPHHVMMGEPGWMFEGEKAGSYHVVCRGTSSLASLKKAAMFLVDVSKLDLASTRIRPSDVRNSRDEIH